ncbi:MAG: septum formation protein Maf [Ardenticatenaceae bacterium]|nr:septum formation protein Maf [Ardenticatenaceae bacterium]MCB9446254.1 septum formation protein Maf [Ardenticatenaceae bacterium]
MVELVLASQSPRRRELITLLGYPVRAVSADVDESLVDEPDPAVNVVGTARLKAVKIAKQWQRLNVDGGVVVVAADTTVALGDEMLGKPIDAADARRMLRSLRGRPHKVHTGVVLMALDSGREVSGVNTAVVTMRDYSDAEIEAYVASGNPMDKAGAYAIQHPTFRPVARLDGCFTGVMGLSVCHLLQLFAQLGLAMQADLTAVAAAHQHFSCQLLDEIIGRSR